MTRRAVASVSGGLALAALAAVVGVVAWPEMAAPGYLVAHGWRLYEEVVQQYTPLLVFVVAAAGSALGFDGPTFRLLVALPLLLQGFLLGLANLRGRPRVARFLGHGLALAAVAAWSAYLDAFALWPDAAVAPFALGAVLLLEESERTGRPRPLALAGLVLGLGILVKQTFAWAAIGAGLWLLLSSRRRTPLRLALFAGAAASPCLVFWTVWGAAFGTWAHVRWTFVIPLARHVADMGAAPDRADLLEAVAPFLVLPALALLAPPRTLRRTPSPLAWVAVATTLMAWPRWGLLHLAATTALLGLALARAVRAAFAASRRLSRARRGPLRLAAFASGLALLLTHVAVGAIGGGRELAAQAGAGVRYWDEPPLAKLAGQAATRVGPGRELFSYHAANDNVYPRSGTFPPGRLFVNTDFWFFLEEDDLDARLVARLGERAGLPVLFRRPFGPDLDHARETALFRFLQERTRVVGPAYGSAEWREVLPLDAAPARRAGADDRAP